VLVCRKKLLAKKTGKVWNKVEGTALGIGIFSLFVEAEKVPDEIEGKEVIAIFKIGIDRAFKPYLRLDRFEI
jgi:hypothetical protein